MIGDRLAEALNREVQYVDLQVTKADETHLRVQGGAGVFFIHVDEFHEMFGRLVWSEVAERLRRPDGATVRVWIAVT